MSDEEKSPGRGQAAFGGGKRRPGDQPFVPFARYEDVVVKCGHIVKFGIMPDGKDRFREERRKKAISRDCKECRERKQREALEAAEKRRAEKEQLKMLQGERSSPRGKTPAVGRLPDGSRFEVHYNAAKAEWSGTLTIPRPGETSATVTGSRSALFKLLASLDEQYRATLG